MIVSDPTILVINRWGWNQEFQIEEVVEYIKMNVTCCIIEKHESNVYF